MSTDGAAIGRANGHGLRLTIAVVLAFLIGAVLDDVLVMFLAPVFVTMFAAPNAPGPTWVAAATVTVLIWLAVTATAAVTSFFTLHSTVLVLLLTAFVFLCFWRDAVAGPKPMVGLVLVVAVVVATMTASAAPLAAAVVAALPVAVLISMIAIMIAHALIPAEPEPGATPPDMGPSVRPLRDAALRTLILLPLIVGFLATGRASGFYVLIVAIAVLRVPRPDRAALGLVAANVLGGALAIAAATLVLITPSALFGVTVLAVLVLGLGLVVEGGGPRAQLAQAATGPAVILLMIALAPVDGGEAYANRVVEIVLTLAYVLLAQTLLGAIVRPSPSRA